MTVLDEAEYKRILQKFLNYVYRFSFSGMEYPLRLFRRRSRIRLCI